MTAPTNVSLPETQRAARPRAAFLAFTLTLAITATTRGAPDIQAGAYVALPGCDVLAEPQTLYAPDQVLTLSNPAGLEGWILSCEIALDRLEGQASGQAIPAAVRFVSIRWISGGAGSTAGIIISPDGRQIEAAPGFGEGVFEVEYEVRLDVPALPSAGNYGGVVSFSVQ